jgi:hypothetical protein
MLALLDLTLEDARPLGLVERGDLEDLRRVEPAIGPAAHDGDRLADPVGEKYQCMLERDQKRRRDTNIS